MKKVLYFIVLAVVFCSCSSVNDFHGRWEMCDGNYKRTIEFKRGSDKYVITSQALDHAYYNEAEYTYTYTQVSDDEFIIHNNHLSCGGLDIDADNTCKLVVNGNKMVYYVNLGDDFGITSATYRRK